MKTRNPYGNTKKRKAALAWMAARGITQPRATYPAARFVDVTVTKARAARRLSIVS
jgi:hypothetical protein